LNEKVSKKLQSHEADYVFADLKAQFGSKIRGMVSSSAPLRGEVLDFFTAVMSAPLLECYGMTEVTGIAAMTQEGSAMQGQVGSPTINVEMKLVDLPELGYVTSDPKRIRGEICFRGPIRTPGYFADPVRTLEAIDSEGWMHSGDVGELTAQGCFRIIDRVKHFFKLSQGVYIAPEKLESIYRLSRMISQVFITGRSIEDYIVAVIVPDFKYLARSFPGKTEKEICGLKLAKQAILTDMMALAKKYRLSTLQRPKQIYLETEPFSIANGILNATQKFMRHAAEKKYQDVVEALYKEGPLPIEEYRKQARHRL
jgi:long-chain acyl-CoA synthetase